MSNEIKQVFCTQKGPHGDGSVQWNVVHAASQERIGSFNTEDDADDLAAVLNGGCAAAGDKPGAVIN